MDNGINRDLFVPERTRTEIESDETEAIDYFKKQFKGKTKAQMNEALNGDLVPEARKAINQLMEDEQMEKILRNE